MEAPIVSLHFFTAGVQCLLYKKAITCCLFLSMYKLIMYFWCFGYYRYIFDIFVHFVYIQYDSMTTVELGELGIVGELSTVGKTPF